MKRPKFITFEGPEGSGKSTQIKKAAAFLRKKGYRVLLLREPGGTRISEKIREIILNPRHQEMAQSAELLLYLAARAQIVQEKILPALKQGKVVISDRYEDSTLAYQGFGRGMPIKKIREVSEAFVRGRLLPDLTFVLNIDARKGMERGGRHDRIEKASMKFHKRVQKGFLKLAKQDPKRFVVIDASKPVARVTVEIMKCLHYAY